MLRPALLHRLVSFSTQLNPFFPHHHTEITTQTVLYYKNLFLIDEMNTCKFSFQGSILFLNNLVSRCCGNAESRGTKLWCLNTPNKVSFSSALTRQMACWGLALVYICVFGEVTTSKSPRWGDIWSYRYSGSPFLSLSGIKPSVINVQLKFHRRWKINEVGYVRGNKPFHGCNSSIKSLKKAFNAFNHI